MSALRRYHRLLRTSLMVLLMLGMVTSPTLAAVGQLHAMQHAEVVVAHDAHGHAHSDSGHHGQDGHAGGDTDPDHTAGAHGLLHQAGTVSVTLPEPGLVIAMAPMTAPMLPDCAWLPLPGDSPTNPFRPPIA